MYFSQITFFKKICDIEKKLIKFLLQDYLHRGVLNIKMSPKYYNPFSGKISNELCKWICKCPPCF